MTQGIQHLAELRGGVDPRYDPTLRAYERVLRWYRDYLSSQPGRGVTEGVIFGSPGP